MENDRLPVSAVEVVVMEAPELLAAKDLLPALERLMPAKRLDALALVEIVPRIVSVADEDLLRLRFFGSEDHDRSSQSSNRENLCDHPFYICDFHDVLLAALE